MNTAAQTPAPLEWSALWSAMKAAPAAWIPTTEAMFWHMLECVPPADQTRAAFLVGEADHHNSRGQAVYACFQEARGGFFARYLTREEFRGGQLATVHA